MMVIDLQVTPPRASGGNTRKIYPNPDCNGSAYYRDQLSIIKTNLLNPAEVTFSNVHESSDNVMKRTRLTTISSEQSDTESIASTSTIRASKKKKQIDGGYGWVVVFASLMVSLIADGISFSFGLIYSELLDVFNEGPTKTAWVSSMIHHVFCFAFLNSGSDSMLHKVIMGHLLKELIVVIYSTGRIALHVGPFARWPHHVEPGR